MNKFLISILLLTILHPLWGQSSGSFPSTGTSAGVSQIIAGSNITITPSGGTGAVTVNATGSGTSNPSTCTVNSTTDLCVTLAPYYASTAGLTATTVSGTFAVGTSGSVASCSTFTANEGVYIAGAGAAGAAYIGTVVSCSGTTLTITPATSTSVSSSNVVQHDESAAIQAAITALASTGGNIWFPDGTYLVNGPLQDTGGANAILNLPSIVYGNNTPLPIEIAFRGLKQPTQLGVPEGAIIQTALPAGNLIGGYHSGGSFGNFTNVYLTIDSMTLRGYTNPGFVAVSAFYVAGLRLNHVWCDTGTLPLVAPTTSTSACYQTPSLDNSAFVQLNDVGAFGYYTGFVLGEHTIATSIYGALLNNGFVLQTAITGTPAQVSNSISIDYAWCQQCLAEVVAAGPQDTTVNIQNLDIENASTYGINDPSNLLRGVISYHVPYSAGAVTPTNPSVNGAANVQLVNLDIPSVNTFNAGTINAGTPIGTSGWPLGAYVASGPVAAGVQSGAGTWAFMTANSAGSPGLIYDNNHFFTFATSTANSGAGYAPFVELAQGFGVFISSPLVYGWGNVSTSAIDAGISRDSAGVVDVGNGTAGDKSGTVKASSVVVNGGASTVYICSGGTFAGLLATSSGACTGGSGTATHLSIN